ncbi:hypothetical protein ACFL2L_01555 [Patescibacteria group bacterium]
MDTDNLNKKIISTLSYFSIFDYPLTAFEIWKFLFSEKNCATHSLNQIENVMNSLILQNSISKKHGFYSIKNKLNIEELVEKRMHRHRIAQHKYKKALFIIKIISYLPSIKMVGVCNSLSYNNAHKKSDIDLFIITKKNHIWLARFIIVGILKLLKMRPTTKNTSDKICASFFASEDNLDFKKIQINHSMKIVDIYLIYWIATLVPIYSSGDAYNKFINKNLWIKKHLLQWQPYITNNERVITTNPIVKLFCNIFYIIPEKLAKKIQLAIMPIRLREMANKDSKVIINDSILKFHDKDRREEYYHKWEDIKSKL